jgi:hypothetical protein
VEEYISAKFTPRVVQKLQTSVQSVHIHDASVPPGSHNTDLGSHVPVRNAPQSHAAKYIYNTIDKNTDYSVKSLRLVVL